MEKIISVTPFSSSLFHILSNFIKKAKEDKKTGYLQMKKENLLVHVTFRFFQFLQEQKSTGEKMNVSLHKFILTNFLHQ